MSRSVSIVRNILRENGQSRSQKHSMAIGAVAAPKRWIPSGDAGRMASGAAPVVDFGVGIIGWDTAVTAAADDIAITTATAAGT